MASLDAALPLKPASAANTGFGDVGIALSAGLRYLFQPRRAVTQLDRCGATAVLTALFIQGFVVSYIVLIVQFFGSHANGQWIDQTTQKPHEAWRALLEAQTHVYFGLSALLCAPILVFSACIWSTATFLVAIMLWRAELAIRNIRYANA